MKREIKVHESTESVTILTAEVEGSYRVIWHRSDGGPDEELHVTPDRDDTVEEAIAKDLRRRLGP